ncbi:UDP-3-O-acyl-N-acetylglucosamine deacetylase [Candidatus Micrarchaeota archaeon]|nr:UDP-3-O-acyl-N-acetylglucosamine deacetylase [Candidatus Micrarchaeota archaeon]
MRHDSGFQHTIKKPFEITGQPYQPSRPVTLSFYPAPADTGIVFRRSGVEIPVNLKNLHSGGVGANSFLGWNNTEIRNGRHVVSTPEHLLAALRAAGVDNVYVDISGKHVPQFDWSAGRVMMALKNNLASQQIPRSTLHIDYAVASSRVMRTPEQLAQLQAELENRGIPPDVFRVEPVLPHIVFDAGHPGKPDLIVVRPAKGAHIGSGFGYSSHRAFQPDQFHFMPLDRKHFKDEVMDARSPGFVGFWKGHGAQLLLAIGRIPFPGGFRIHGMTERNLVISGHSSSPRVLNNPNNPETTLRYGGQEMARHKTMDTLGAIAAMPGYLQEVELFVFKASHAHVITALKELQNTFILSDKPV